MLTTLILLFAVSLGLNLSMYLIAYALQTDKITDISYSITFIVLAVWTFNISDKSIAALFTLVFILIWASRLGLYLLNRIKFMGRDERFDNIRNNKWSFLGFWFVQGISVFIISISFIPHMIEGHTVGLKGLIIGSALAGIGWIIEAIADHQKYQFKKSHPDKFMSKGIWAKIRHPNYLGEILFWLGISLIQWGSNSTINLISFIGPLWISFILLKFSGIPILEKSWDKKYGMNSDFVEYKSRTYRLIPGIY